MIAGMYSLFAGETTYTVYSFYTQDKFFLPESADLMDMTEIILTILRDSLCAMIAKGSLLACERNYFVENLKMVVWV